jgi:hypothetical protein
MLPRGRSRRSLPVWRLCGSGRSGSDFGHLYLPPERPKRARSEGGSAMLVPSTLPVALYARVSTTHQLEAQTVDRQIAALHERMVSDAAEGGGVLECIDEG